MVFLGCGEPQQAPGLLARVGDASITVDGLRAYESALPEATQSPAQHRARLQTLIDRELLLLEARQRHLDADAAVLGQLDQSQSQELAETMLRRQLEPAVVTDDEVARAYGEAGWGEQLKALEIFVPTEALARQVVEQLQKGVAFEEAGRQYSVDPYFGVPSGGPKQTLYWRFDRPRALVEALLPLPPRGVTPPVPLQGGYAIAMVVERRQADLAEAAAGIRDALLEEERQQLRHSYLRHLKWDFGTSYHPEGMELVVAVLRGEVADDALDEAQRRLPVYTFEGFGMDVAEVLAAMGPARGRREATADAVHRKLADGYLPNKLMARDAQRKGVEQTEDFQQWRRTRLEDLMLTRLRELVLADAPAPAEADLERYYEEHKSRFRAAAWARLQEILVADAELAQQLATRVREGADLQALARAHSTRKTEDGILDVSTSHTPAYGETWMNAVMNAPLDEVRGPIKTTGGYSVFRVLERHPEHYYTLADARVRRAVARDLGQQLEREGFNRFVEDLRQRYADRIELHEEPLESLEPVAGSPSGRG